LTSWPFHCLKKCSMGNYDAFAETFSNSRKNMKWAEIEHITNEYFEYFHEKSILDIGCGNGRLLTHFQDLRIYPGEYVGIDNSKNMIKEAKKLHPESSFLWKDMSDLESIGQTWNAIIGIASFHHLPTFTKRMHTLQIFWNILLSGGIVALTNWNLLSEENSQKYQSSKIPDSRNEFGSEDFLIKIGKFERFYHAFCLQELEKLAEKTHFRILENRIFPTQRNIITILQKK